MSDAVKVTFGELDAAAGNIKATSQKIMAELDDIVNFVNQLAGIWTGEAQETYRVAQDQLNQASNDLNMTLNQIGIAVDTANQNYRAAESANARRFG